MMRKNIGQALMMIILVAVFFSCKKTPKLAKPYIDDKKVVALLADMHFATESAKLNKKLNVDSLKTVYTNQVLTIHQVTEEKYERIIAYLESDLNTYYVIEQKVHSKLKEIQGAK